MTDLLKETLPDRRSSINFRFYHWLLITLLRQRWKMVKERLRLLGVDKALAFYGSFPVIGSSYFERYLCGAGSFASFRCFVACGAGEGHIKTKTVGH